MGLYGSWLAGLGLARLEGWRVSLRDNCAFRPTLRVSASITTIGLLGSFTRMLMFREVNDLRLHCSDVPARTSRNKLLSSYPMTKKTLTLTLNPKP